MIRRRSFVVGAAAGAGAILASPLISDVRPPKKIVARIGWLAILPPDLQAPEEQALLDEMRRYGYILGENCELVVKDSSPQFLPELVAYLVKSKVDIIIAVDQPAAKVINRVRRSIPIVMAANPRPFALGFVASADWSRATFDALDFEKELAHHRPHVVKQGTPRITGVELKCNGFSEWLDTLDDREGQIAAQRSARSVGAEYSVLKAMWNDELTGVDSLRPKFWHRPIWEHERKLLSLILDRDGLHRIGASHRARLFVELGGLMSLEADAVEIWRRIGISVGKILTGTKPADLAVEEPTKFNLAINLRTAKALGLSVPSSLVARADHVIE